METRNHWLLKTLCCLAHLSQRLIGDLIGYSWSGVRPSSVRRRRRSQCSKIFFSETALPIKAKFYVEPPWVRGTIFWLYDQDGCSFEPPWLTTLLKLKIRQRKRAYKKAKRTNLENHWSAFKILRNEATALIRSSKNNTLTV